MGDNEKTQEIPIASGAPDALPPLKSGGIRRGIYMLVLAVLQSAVVATWVAKHFGFSMKLVSVDDLQAIGVVAAAGYSAVVGSYVGVRNILKRIEAGKDPANPALPIKAPAAVSVVKRLTSG